MLKLDILIVRNPDMTYDQFLAYWRDRHAALFSSQPIVKKTVRRYVQSRIVSDTPAGAFLAPFDGIAQIWFDNLGGFLEYLQSSNYNEVIRQTKGDSRTHKECSSCSPRRRPSSGSRRSPPAREPSSF
jgi:uncharacterized protein (TIGR02118 family)